MPRASLVLVAICSFAILLTTTAARAVEPMSFVTRQGDQLRADGKPLRFVSFNVPNLLVNEDAYSFTSPNPFRWPDEFEIEDALESIRQLGGQVVRTYTISVYRDDSEMGRTVHVLAPGEFNEEAFRTLDKVLEIAGRKGIRVIIPLVDNWKWMGGVPQYAAFRNKPESAFWSDPEIIADFKQTIEHVLNRTNTYTGVRYRDDPTIFGWETGNEIDATEAWTRDIAAYLKQLDPNHLVVDGRSLHGIAPWQVAEPNTDVLSTHHYPHGSTSFVPAIRAAHAAAKGKKPYFIGEFGFVPTPEIEAVLDTTIDDGIAGAMLWSLRYHRREGGFYWHMEVGTGGNFYKAYHWPGFKSGEAYDEQAVMTLARDKAFAIQGQTIAPPIAPPAAPQLLPIETPAAISWQGAAGAAGYDIERATDPQGPWQVVANNVSDADVQYRPLWSDESVEPGRDYYYRVAARNAGGVSAASNVVGPVRAEYRTLVDECRDFSRLAAHSDGVAIHTDNVRRLQEDAHRLALAPGESIDYELSGPVRGWRVSAFAADGDVALELAAAHEGDFTPLATERQTFGSGSGDYGYLVPLLFSGAADNTATPRRLRIGAPKTNREPLEIGRVEIDWTSAE